MKLRFSAGVIAFVIVLGLLAAAQDVPDASAPITQTQNVQAAESPPSDSAAPPAPDLSSVTKPVDRALVFEATAPTDPAVFELSATAQKFQFGKVDLELLKQVDAFDRYLEDHGMVYDDPVVTGYVERIGRTVVPPNSPTNVKWRFRVIRDPVPNAFALPNGSVYINSGLLSRLQNEAQLAGVLAHESTHVFNRHTYTSYHDMRKKVVAIEVLQVGATAAGAGGLNAGVVNAIGNLIPAILVETMFGYRRELEHESDMYAVRVMKAAGYDPNEMAKALDSLRNGPEVDLSQESSFWSDHPKLDDRVRDTSEAAKQVGEPAGGGHIEQFDYIASTKNAVRHDANLALLLGRPRTAVSIAERLIELEPNNPDDYALLGDAYRKLGALPAKPTADELTENGKKRTRKMMSKLTQAECEKALLNTPEGKTQFEANCKSALEAYTKALALNANNAPAVRGMGLLDEAQGYLSDAAANLKRYLELAPNARDARQIRMRLEKLSAPRSNTGDGQ